MKYKHLIEIVGSLMLNINVHKHHWEVFTTRCRWSMMLKLGLVVKLIHKAKLVDKRYILLEIPHRLEIRTFHNI